MILYNKKKKFKCRFTLCGNIFTSIWKSVECEVMSSVCECVCVYEVGLGWGGGMDFDRYQIETQSASPSQLPSAMSE